VISLNRAAEYIDWLIEATMREGGIPGMTLAVTDRERTLRMFSYGGSDVASGTPVTPDSVFEIGSLGKPFTVIPLLQLKEAGKIDLQAPVSRDLPWFEVQSPGGPITIHHLLCHTSGIVRGTDIAPHGLYESWALRDLKTNCAPGEYFRYSNLGYKTLGFLLEHVMGESLPSIIASRVLQPLGMTHTYPSITLGMQGKTTTGYTSVYDDRPEHVSHPITPAVWAEYAAGDGALASTVGDMATYLRLLLNRGRGPGGPLIGEESFGLMTARHVWTGGDYYGYGLATYDVDGHSYIGHGGGNAGFRSAMVIDMEAGLGVVLLANRMGETDPLVEVAQQALTAVRHEAEGLAMPALEVVDPRLVPNAGAYAGSYRSAERTLDLVADGTRLSLRHEGAAVPLERRTADSFYVPHPDFDLALLDFVREDGEVVEAFHGGEWYTRGRRQEFAYPEEWDAFTGHYRCRSPELSNFRVAVRKDSLVLLNPWGNVEPLIPVAPDLFRVGADVCSPETLRFSAVADGEALRADYSGCPYYRTFTP
jgi:D-alanyl-D-alanine carboxypeptidase